MNMIIYKKYLTSEIKSLLSKFKPGTRFEYHGKYFTVCPYSYPFPFLYKSVLRWFVNVDEGSKVCIYNPTDPEYNKEIKIL